MKDIWYGIKLGIGLFIGLGFGSAIVGAAALIAVIGFGVSING